MTEQHLIDRNKRIRARRKGQALPVVILVVFVMLVLAMGIFVLVGNQGKPQTQIPHQTKPVTGQELYKAVKSGGITVGGVYVSH